MINQIGDLKLNIDQQTGEFVWASNDLKIYATRNDAEAGRLVELRVWARDINGNEYESDGDVFFLSPGTQAEQMSEYLRVIKILREEMYSYCFWEDQIKNLNGFIADVFCYNVNKFLTK